MATAAGKVNSAYISTIPFLEQRDILKDVVDVNAPASFLDLMDEMGRAVPTAVKKFDHYVNDTLYKAALVGTGLAANLTAQSTATITLDGGAVKPIVGEVLITKGFLTALVTEVAGNDVTIRGLDAIAQADLAAGDTISFFTNAYAEGTGVNVMRKPNLTKVQNSIQIFKTSTVETDIAAGTKIEVEFDGKPYFFMKQQHDAFLKHRLDIQYGFLYNPGIETTDADGNPVLMTTGLHRKIQDGGIQHTVTTGGTVALTDFANMSRKYDKARADKEMMILAGGEIDNQIDLDFATNSPFDAGGVSYAAFNGSREKAVGLGFESWYMFGRTFHKSRLEAVDNNQVTVPTADFKFDQYAYIIPTGKAKTEMGGGMVDRLRTRYMELHDGTTTRYREKLLGGLAPIPTSNVDELEVVYTSHEGLDVVGVDHFGWLFLNKP